MMNRNYSSGFTLIELMIVLAIVAILSSLTVSYYGDHVIKTKRTDGRAAVLSIATSLDKCKAIYGSYNNANCSISSGDSIDSPKQLYKIGVVTTSTTFTLTASPVAGKSQENDSKCTSIILNQLAQQTGTGSDSTTCW